MHRCEMCGVSVMSAAQLAEHMSGRRHRERQALAGLTPAELATRKEQQLLQLILGLEPSAIAPAAKRQRVQSDSGVRADIRRFCGKHEGGGKGEECARRVLLYYKYVDVDDAAAAREWQHTLCTALGLRGRIHVASEGINGTCGGSTAATSLYEHAMNCHARWAQLFGASHARKRLV